MCRSIKPLLHCEPPADRPEVQAAALQFVRKVSGFSKPRSADRAAFDQAVEEVTAATGKLLASLQAPEREER